MTQELEQAISKLLPEWHEAGREFFERRYENLDYDCPTWAKTVKERRKYVALDSGTSGAFLVDKNTGDIFNIKAYGVPKARVGNINGMTGGRLYQFHR